LAITAEKISVKHLPLMNKSILAQLQYIDYTKRLEKINQERQLKPITLMPKTVQAKY